MQEEPRLKPFDDNWEIVECTDRTIRHLPKVEYVEALQEQMRVLKVENEQLKSGCFGFTGLVKDLLEQVRVLREALQFYNDEDNYKILSDPFWSYSTAPPTLIYPLGYPSSNIIADKGKIAKQALTATENDTKTTKEE